jgi:magnesium-transporting ATPase (P-type)
MMDELELLKKDWQKKEVEHPKVSYDDIYKMLLTKSSSIVKWIFIISIIEFTLPHLLYLIPSINDGEAVYDNLGLKTPMLILTVIQYIVIAYFIYQFYRRYKEISVLDNAKKLMSKIIRTRKTVKNYIIFSLIMIVLFFTITTIGIYINDDFIHSLELSGQDVSNISLEKLKNIKLIAMLAVAGAGIVLTIGIGAIYFLLYGLLLKKLNGNYKELKKLEI